MVAKKSTAKQSTAQETAAGKSVKKTAATARAVKPEKAEKPAKAEKAVESEKAPKAARPAKAEKAAKSVKSGKSSAKKSVTKKSAAKKSTGKAHEEAAAAKTATTTGATTVVAKKAAAKTGTATAGVPKARHTAAEPGALAVRPGEEPWTPAEVDEARAELAAEALRLRSEIESSEESLVGLMRDSQDGAGEDDADTGSKNITREHELGIAANAREVLLQTERALERIEAGTYGICENCGNPIGKARMQAFPRATLCVECKQKQERRL